MISLCGPVRRSLRREAIALACGAALLAAVPAAAAPADPLRATSSYTKLAQVVPGQPNLLRFAIGYAALGDINGDGADDWVNVQGTLNTEGEDESGPLTSYVTFGRHGTRNVDHTAPDPAVRTYENVIIEPAGDVNGDRIDDVFVLTGAEGIGPVAAVLFGGPGIADVRLDRPGVKGFQITGEIRGLIPAGDVNGDGRGDLLTYRETADGDDSTLAALIFGKTTTGAVDGIAPGGAGAVISSGNGAVVPAGFASAVGDFNGDHLSDVAVNRRGAERGTLVLWGRRTWGPVDIGAPGGRGTFLPDVSLLPGTTDVTGDRRDDLFVLVSGDPYDDSGVQPRVLFGDPYRKLPLTASQPLDGAFVDASAVESGDRAQIAPVGDQNGDGRKDLLVLAPSPWGWGSFGSEPTTPHLVLGRAASGPIDVTTAPVVGGAPGPSGLREIGDTDADGLPDVLGIGTPYESSGPIFSNGADILAPRWVRPPAIAPSAFRAGTPARLSGAMTENGKVELVVRRASGETLGTFTIPGGPEFDGTWDGRAGRDALPPGDYRTTVTPIDPSGNRGPAETVAFTILP